MQAKNGLRGFFWLGVAAIEGESGGPPFSFDRNDTAAKTLTPANSYGHLDPRFPRQRPAEIRDADKRAIDTRRRNFEAISPFYDILDIEEGRKGPARDLAIVDSHRPIGPLGHDLHCRPGLRQEPDPDQTVTETRQGGLNSTRNARRQAGILDQTRLFERA